MEFFRLCVEGHRHSLTIYVAGVLCERARLQLERAVADAPLTTLVLRVDLRAVQVIDPSSFVLVARALSTWRDRTSGRVLIEFPERSHRPAGHCSVLERSATGTARAASPAPIFESGTATRAAS